MKVAHKVKDFSYFVGKAAPTKPKKTLVMFNPLIELSFVDFNSAGSNIVFLAVSTAEALEVKNVSFLFNFSAAFKALFFNTIVCSYPVAVAFLDVLGKVHYTTN